MSDGLSLEVTAESVFVVDYTEEEVKELIEAGRISDEEELIKETKGQLREEINHQANGRELKSVDVTAEVVDDE